MRNYEFYKDKLQGISFPYACLDGELFRQNIKTNLERAGDKKIRIASKSIRCVGAMNMIFEHASQFEGIMTYHGLEAVFLAKEGFDNLLMGYPIVDANILREIGITISKGKYIVLMVDRKEHLEIINKIGKELNIRFPICIDLDLSDNYPGLRFGVWRSNIQKLSDLEKLLQEIKKFDFIRLDGLMGYEAQVAGLGDDAPNDNIKNAAIKFLKKRSLINIQKRRQEAVDLISANGFDLKIVNGGGTGSLESTREEKCVTEITVGSGFYNSHLFDYYKNFNLKPALFFGVQIVRQPTPDIYTCHGGGFIASGGIDPIKAPTVYLPPNGKLDKNEGAGEVQTPVRFSKLQHSLSIGDPIFFRHAKAGELCERFNKLYFLENGRTRELLTYRGQNLSFG